MVTTTESKSSPDSGVSARTDDLGQRGDEPRTSVWGTPARLLLVAAVLVGVVWIAARGLSWQSGNRLGFETMTAQPGRLMVTIPAEGNIESANNRELKCQVAGGARIIWIIPDGSHVEAGAELVRLDESGFEQQLNAQKIVYERAVATKIQAEQDFGAAEVSVREFIEGSYLKDLKAAQALITVSQQNLNTNANALVHTERMFRKGFVTALQLEADKFAVERSKLDLQAAETAKKVLEQFTKPKTLKQLEAVRDAADARRRSEQASVNLEKTKLDRIQQQLKFCVIRAPQQGMVIYGNDPEQSSRGGGMDAPQIEEGSMIRDRQTILRLPDLNDMQVRTNVHESRVPHIGPGMAARIKVLDHVWNGRVKSIANRPAPNQRYQTPTKNYSVFISIEGDTSALKPGMTANVEILLADLHDVITVPVTSIVEQDDQFLAWIKQGAETKKRHVTLGKTDDRVIEVSDGLKAGDEVITNPRATVAEAMEMGGFERKDVEDDSRFKSTTAKTAISPAAS